LIKLVQKDGMYIVNYKDIHAFSEVYYFI